MSNADAVIRALHTGHEQLVDLAADLSEQQLTTPTQIGEWTVAQVLSHLGSGAVISHKTLSAALAGKPNPGPDSNREVWAVWDAMGPVEQLDGFVKANQELLDAIAEIPEETRETLRVDVGFLPAPVDLATTLTLRLNELALHSWDVRAFLDDAAVVEAGAVPILLELVPTFLSFVAKADRLGRTATLRVDLADPSRRLGLALTGDAAQITGVPGSPTGSLALPAEAWLRLVYGRLRRENTPESDVTVEGPVTLDELRRVFPGF